MLGLLDGDPLLCVTTAGAGVETGWGAATGAATAAAGAAPAAAPARGFARRVTWMVRWMTFVRTFGFGGFAADVVTWPEFELIATPASPPRPITVAIAAVLVFTFFTADLLESWNRDSAWAIPKGRPGQG